MVEQIDYPEQGAPPLGVSEVSEQAVGKDNTSHKTSTFSEEYKLPFEGLLYLGKLSKAVTVFGHKFIVKTLNDAEVLEVFQLLIPYKESQGYTKAYRVAVLAAAIEEVDGKPLYSPLSPSEEGILRRKFEEVTKWYRCTTEAVYSEYLEFEKEVEAMVVEVGNA